MGESTTDQNLTMKDQNGRTIRLRIEHYKMLEDAAVKVTIKTKEIIKPSDILHKLIEEYLDDVTELVIVERNKSPAGG